MYIVLQVISAEGERQVVSALQVAAKELGASPYALQLKYINTLHNMVASPTTANAGYGASTHTTVMFPVPMEMAETLTPQFLQQLAHLFPKPPVTASTNNVATPLPTAQVSRKSSAGPTGALAAAGAGAHSKRRSQKPPDHRIDVPDECVRATQSPSPPPPPPPPVPPSPSDSPDSSHSEPEMDHQRANVQQPSFNSEQVSRRSSRKHMAAALGVPIERAGTLPTIPSPSTSSHEQRVAAAAVIPPPPPPPPHHQSHAMQMQMQMQPLRVLTEMPPPCRHESHHYQNFAPPAIAGPTASSGSHLTPAGENGQSRGGAPQPPPRPLPAPELRPLLPNEFPSAAHSAQNMCAGGLSSAMLSAAAIKHTQQQQFAGGSHGEGEYAVPFALQTGHPAPYVGLHAASARQPASAAEAAKSLALVLRPLPAQIPEGLLVDLSGVPAPSHETAM